MQITHRRSSATAIAAAGLFTLLSALPAAAQQFNWRGQIPAGRAIEIKGVNGDITATRTGGGEVRVTASRDARRSNPEEVRIVVLEHAAGVTICAVYPAPRGRAENECAPGTGGRSNVQNNDVNVHFTVEVPAGVDLIARTVNGSVAARDMASDVRASTVNGSIDVATSGLARANTVNGSINARIGRSDWRDDLVFETVNGQIVLTVAADLNAELRAATVNGDITSDFPVTVRGTFGPRSISGVVGSGGRTLQLKTVNGSIGIRRM
jgi:DUF4097 and DUF4098 domain-containing protein YvlB